MDEAASLGLNKSAHRPRPGKLKIHVKKTSYILLLFVFLTAFGVSVAGAESYISGSMGLASVSDANIDTGSNSGEIEFDSGFTATGAYGQTLGDAGRIEVELGYRTNDIDKVNGLGITDIDGDIATVSLMGNAFYGLSNNSRFTPFVGAGLGFANIEADIERGDEEDDTVFAYQVAAGASMAVTETLDIDLQYRYFATEDPDFDGLKAEYASHNLMFGLTLYF